MEMEGDTDREHESVHLVLYSLKCDRDGVRCPYTVRGVSRPVRGMECKDFVRFVPSSETARVSVTTIYCYYRGCHNGSDEETLIYEKIVEVVFEITRL
jgi:hypothetical protein